MKDKVKNKLFPTTSRHGRAIRRLYKKIHNRTNKKYAHDYESWIEHVEPSLFSNTLQELKDAKSKPLISIVVPCYNTPKKYIIPLVESLTSQHYENWQLCLADGSTDMTKSSYIEALSRKDKRILYKRLKKNEGIVGNTNQGIISAKGDYVGFLDHDDLLSPYALAEVVLAINRTPNAELFYSDEDKISDDGRVRSLPFFKPDWSPELLLGVNYITHFTVAKAKLVKKVDGLREGFDGSQDYDFLLRATEKAQQIVHIPKILYHWRLADGSTAKSVGEKNYADDAGVRALRDAVSRRKIDAEVISVPDRPTNYRLKYRLPKKHPLVSIIIPFKDKAQLLDTCVSSILTKTTYKNYEIILVSNNSIEKETSRLLDRLKKNAECKVYYWDHPFNYSAINNFGSKKARGEYLVLLNNDTEVISPSWLEELIGVASQREIGAVGPLLRYPDSTIQHAGVILGMAGMAGHVFRLRKPEEWTDFGLPTWPRNYLAVTGACLAISKKKYQEVGGLDETFIIAGNDVALGISLSKKGYRNVYWPFAELIHYENVSVGSYSNVPKSDYEHSLTYYKPYLPNKDPFFNKNLDIMNEQVGIRAVI